MADGGAWHKRTVIVRDYLPASRKADLEAVVAAFNDVLPKRAPHLRYVAMPEIPCDKVHAKGQIAVCVDASLQDPETTYVQKQRVISSAKIAVPTTHGALCHEMMHALSDIADDYTFPYMTESCVQGGLETPGPFDVQFLRWAYKKFGRAH